jgi:predicted nucleic acid-binding protein
MMQEAQSRGLSGSNPAKALAQNPALVRQLTQYRAEVEDLLCGDLLVLSVEGLDFIKAAELQRAHGLMTNDSLSLAVALRHGVYLVATADPQLDSIPGFTVFKPDDL